VSETHVDTAADPVSGATWWHVTCSCGWLDVGYDDEDTAHTAALLHRLGQHTAGTGSTPLTPGRRPGQP
jgi:hypothetical protein